MTVEIREFAPADPDLDRVWPVMGELRADLYPDEMAARYVTAAQERGLRLVAAFDGDRCTAVATFHVLTNLHLGRHVYVDDLVTTAAERSSGHGARLLDHIVAVAAAAGCEAVRLDSGVQRHGAHRFYLRERFDILAHSFVRRLP